MLDKPISPLRQRMIESDMTARRFNEHTQRDYVRNVRNRLRPSSAGRQIRRGEGEDLRRFQLHMAKQKQMSAGSINAAIAALRTSFSAVTLERPDLVLPPDDREQAAAERRSC